MDERVEQSPIYFHLVPPPRRPPLFRLQTPVDGEDGAQHVKRPTGQRHLVHLKARSNLVVEQKISSNLSPVTDLGVARKSVADKSFVVRRSIIFTDVEWLVEEFVICYIVADDHLVGFTCLAPPEEEKKREIT